MSVVVFSRVEWTDFIRRGFPRVLAAGIAFLSWWRISSHQKAARSASRELWSKPFLKEWS